jgi:hypothetical protein
MPSFEKRTESQDELEIATRIMQTVQRQIGTYRMALEKVQLLREEFKVDESLANTTMASPDSMSRLLVERGIPENLAMGMAAEDFQDPDFGGGGRLGWWTWDCCCSGCCLTDCGCTVVTVSRAQEADQ